MPSWLYCDMGRTKTTLDVSPAPQDYRQPGGDWLRILPGLVISLISLGLVFYFADIKKLGEALQLADYRYVSLSMLVTLSWLGVRGMVWRTLLQDRASYAAVFWSLNEGYLLNNLLPFRLGEFGRAFLLARKSRLEFWHVLSTVVIERVLDLALAVSLLISTLPFVVGATWAREAAAVVGVAVLLGFAALYVLARNQEHVLRLVERLGQRWPVLIRLAGKAVMSLVSGLSVLNDGKRFVRALGWVLLNWLIAIGQYFIMLNAFFPEARGLWAVFSLGVASLGIAAPSSPGALGVLELSIVGSLSLFGLEPSSALAMAITIHLLQYLITGALGTFALARDGESLIGLYRKLRSRSSASI